MFGLLAVFVLAIILLPAEPTIAYAVRARPLAWISTDRH
jgi:hypothetical protein